MEPRQWLLAVGAAFGIALSMQASVQQQWKAGF